jgi:hypothetical protein
MAEARPSITGVDWGILYKEGQRRGRGYGIRFHVAAKLPLEVVPPGMVLPKELWGVPCDVLQVRFELQEGRATDELDPLQPGASVGNLQQDFSGTLGGFVVDSATGRRGILSNWHVLCGTHAAKVDDDIIQPGPQHLQARPQRPIGKLKRWTDLAEGLDAAYAELNDGLNVDLAPFQLTEPIGGVAAPTVGMRVRKVGAKSLLTHAVIDGVEGAYRLNYVRHGDVGDRFMDALLLVVDPAHRDDNLSMPGDSGALWVEVATNRAVALHFAGERNTGPLAEKSIAHPLPRVLQRLGLEMMPGGT